MYIYIYIYFFFFERPATQNGAGGRRKKTAGRCHYGERRAEDTWTAAAQTPKSLPNTALARSRQGKEPRQREIVPYLLSAKTKPAHAVLEEM